MLPPSLAIETEAAAEARMEIEVGWEAESGFKSGYMDAEAGS